MRINNKIFLSLASLLLGLSAKAENLSDLKVPNAQRTWHIVQETMLNRTILPMQSGCELWFE